MRVIELDGDFLGQRIPVRIVALKAAHKVGERTCDQKKFLQKSQALSRGGGVIGIQHSGQRFRLKSLAQSANKIAGAKLLEVEIVGRGRRPQPQRVDGLSSVADHWPIERDTEQAGGPIRNNLVMSPTQLEGAVQLYLYLLVRAGDLPGIGVAQPVVGAFLLPAIDDGLPKHAVLVAQTVPRGRKLHGGHRIEVTRRKPSQASVPQARVRFLLDQFEPIKTFLLERVLQKWVEQEVGNIIGQ